MMSIFIVLTCVISIPFFKKGFEKNIITNKERAIQAVAVLYTVAAFLFASQYFEYCQLSTGLDIVCRLILSIFAFACFLTFENWDEKDLCLKVWFGISSLVLFLNSAFVYGLIS